MMEKIQRSKLCLFLLIMVMFGAFFIRAEGICWPKLHPDEPVIGSWLEKSPQYLSIKDRVYPNGAFTLVRPFVWACQAFVRASGHFKYFCGTSDRVRDVRPDGIYLGRWINAIAGTLLCFIVFLFVSRITRSPWAGLFAAALIGFSQYAVEHSHYAETDIIALLVLSLALLLLVIARDASRLRWFVFAALASGFAAGTKFTLTALAPVVVIEAILCARRQAGGSFWLGAVKAAGLGILLFGIGFAIANPAVLLKTEFFMSGLASEKRRVFAETMLNLGPFGARAGVRYVHHLLSLAGYIKTLGSPWIFLAAAGLPCVALGFARRYWAVLLLFPLMFAFYWIFMAPWVRSQEFLFFLPSFAVLAVLPLKELWRRKHFLFRTAAVVFAVSAMVVNGSNGLRVGALFGWKDTRLMAKEWLNARLPPESRLAVESYAEAACPDMLNAPLCIRKVEQSGMAFLTEKKSDYLLRSAGVSGRGLLNPLTGKLYPEPEKALADFLAGSELLCSWAPAAGPPSQTDDWRPAVNIEDFFAKLSYVLAERSQGLATFVSPAIELYGLRHFTPQISLQIELPRPALIVNSAQNQVGRQTFCPIGQKLSSAAALLIDRFPQIIAVGGPEKLSKPVFLVLNTMERGAVVKVRGFGISRKAVLDPYDTAIVPLQRTGWRLRPKPFETITLQTEPVRDVIYIPCFVRLAFTVSEAVRICLDTAREDRILKYFSKEMLEKELSPDVKYLARSVLQPAEPDEQAALSLQNEIGKCRQADPEAISINGNSGYYYDRFARARLQQPYDSACLDLNKASRPTAPMEALKELSLVLPEDLATAAAEHQYCQTLMLPVLLSRGKYELRGEVMLREKEPASYPKVPLAVYHIEAGTGDVSHVELQPGKWSAFALAIRPSREIQPCFKFQSPIAARLYLRNMEVVWSLASALETVASALVQEKESENAGFGAESKGKAVFPPWLALVDFDFNPETREVKCVFEALHNNTPKLAVTFWLFRHGEWRCRQKQAISAEQWLGKGERKTIVVRLNQAFSKIKDAEKLGLGMETDVLWHAGAIPLESGEYVIPFFSLID